MIFIFMLFAVLFVTIPASAQEIVVPDGYELVDSLVYRPVSSVDTTLAGRNVFSIMPSKDLGDKAAVEVYQSQEIMDLMNAHVESNREREISGYRVRIFFDNRQSARADSEEVLKRFESLYHDIVAYRTYANPYFKVTVGDFRTKSEAMSHLVRIRHDFPSAFVVKENINFPVVDRLNAYVVDTIKVLRPIK